MKIITHGNTCKEKVCNKCSALLSYCEADIITESRCNDFFAEQHYSSRKYIVCPECNSQIDLSWVIDGVEQIKNNTDMTNREKELREKIAEECSKKTIENKYGHNYRISQDNERYDFRGCPDDLECIENYTFSELCDEVDDYDCKECWKNFLRGEKC